MGLNLQNAEEWEIKLDEEGNEVISATYSDQINKKDIDNLYKLLDKLEKQAEFIPDDESSEALLCISQHGQQEIVRKEELLKALRLDNEGD